MCILSYCPLLCVELAVLLIYACGTKKKSRERITMTVMPALGAGGGIASIYVNTRLSGARPQTRAGDAVLGLELESQLHHCALGP